MATAIQTTIQKWGNSQAIRLPRPALDAAMLQENDPVEVIAENGTITIKKATRKRRAKKSVDERLEEFYNKPIGEILADDSLYTPSEYDWGQPVGREVW